MNFYNANSHQLVAKISNWWKIENPDKFSNDIGSHISRYSLIPLNELIDKKDMSEETYQFLADGGEAVDEYIEKSYPYAVTFYQEYGDKVYETKLGIYEVVNELNEEKKYYLGYNANRVYECNYIYDIKEGKLYRKPDICTVEFTPISDLYDDDTITVKQAYEVMNNYITQKENGTIIQKVRWRL